MTVPAWLLAVVLTLLACGVFGGGAWALSKRKPAKPEPEGGQDPLPESNWFFRRVLVFASGAISKALIGWIIYIIAKIGRVAVSGDKPQVAIEAITGLVGIAVGLLVLLAIDRFLYLISPSAEQAGKWFATISAFKNGIGFRRVAARSDHDESEVTQAGSTQAQPETAPATIPQTIPEEETR